MFGFGKNKSEETVKVVKTLFTNVKAVIGFKSEETNTHHVWWYDEYFSNQFLEGVLVLLVLIFITSLSCKT